MKPSRGLALKQSTPILDKIIRAKPGGELALKLRYDVSQGSHLALELFCLSFEDLEPVLPGSGTRDDRLGTLRGVLLCWFRTTHA